MLVKEIMTRNVIFIDADKTVFDACKIYRDKKIGCLLIKDKQKKFVGMITERDIIERTICEGKDPKKTLVSEIMSVDLINVHVLDNVEKAIDIMIKNNLKKLPTVSNNNIIGIITVTDISRVRPDLSKRFMDSWVKPSWKD